MIFGKTELFFPDDDAIQTTSMSDLLMTKRIMEFILTQLSGGLDMICMTRLSEEKYSRTLHSYLYISAQFSRSPFKQRRRAQGVARLGAKMEFTYTGQHLLFSRWVIICKENPDGTTRIVSTCH